MLTGHMLAVVLTTNVVVPAVLLVWRNGVRPAPAMLGPSGLPGRWVGFAASTLVALVWTLHLPIVIETAYANPAGIAVAMATLIFASLAFWSGVIAGEASRPWQTLAALLLATKAFGLLGVLLVFSPRPLYAPPVLADAPAEALADQHAAGLAFMSIATLGFITAAVTVAARVLSRAEERPGWQGGAV